MCNWLGEMYSFQMCCNLRCVYRTLYASICYFILVSVTLFILHCVIIL
jgi:hypothetical protein